MRIAICDDERLQREQLITYCKRYDSSLSVDTFFSAIDLLMAIECVSYDIVLMEIEMPPPNGFEVAEALKKRVPSPLVIFISKSSTYTIQGYGVAFRYLQKPIAYETFESVISLAIKECEPQKISFLCNGVFHILRVNEIIYCEAFDHNLTVHTCNGSYTARMTLSEFQKQLPTEDFGQPHKSYIVNLNYVQSVGASNIMLASNSRERHIPLSKGKRKNFIQKLGDYIGR